MAPRAAGPDDAPALIARLQGDARAAMFPLAALYDGLLRGPAQPLDAPRAIHGWLTAEGLVTLSGAGYLSAYPGGARDWRGFAPLLAGRQVAGMVVADGGTASLLTGLGLEGAPRRHQDEEPGFALRLSDLRMPEVEGCTLAPPQDHLAQVIDWRVTYLAELFTLTGPEAEARARREVAGWIEADSHRVLLVGGVPAAMSGFNAQIPGAEGGTVQIGGVFTPPEARGRGLARRIVALHLADARGRGVRDAVLFAANAAAAAAYRAIGFVERGSMGIVEFDGLAEVPATVTVAQGATCP